MLKVLTISHFVQVREYIKTHKAYEILGQTMIFLKQMEGAIRQEFAIGKEPIECHTAHQLTKQLADELQIFCDTIGYQLN